MDCLEKTEMNLALMCRDSISLALVKIRSFKLLITKSSQTSNLLKR